MRRAWLVSICRTCSGPIRGDSTPPHSLLPHALSVGKNAAARQDSERGTPIVHRIQHHTRCPYCSRSSSKALRSMHRRVPRAPLRPARRARRALQTKGTLDGADKASGTLGPVLGSRQGSLSLWSAGNQCNDKVQRHERPRLSELLFSTHLLTEALPRKTHSHCASSQASYI